MKSFFVLASAFWAVLSVAKPLTIQDINRSKTWTNPTWEADVNPISDLPVEERRRLLGAELPQGFDEVFIDQEEEEEREPSLPASFDWRNVNGTNYSSPILDQGRCGSCVAFAAIGALETQMNIAFQTSLSPFQLSNQHLFACGGGGCDMGWRPGEAVAFLKSEGVPDEACFPYQSGAVGEDLSCSKTCSNSKDRVVKLVDYTTPSFLFQSTSAVKKALLKGPLMTTMSVYEDFLLLQVRGLQIYDRTARRRARCNHHWLG